MNSGRDGKVIDFKELAEAYEPLRSKLIDVPGGVTVDFKDALSQRLLTKAILYRDFKLSIDLPEDRLCPPVPNRLNYIHWLRDLHHSLTSWKDDAEADTPVKIIDIGTGASVIYPLLGCATKSSWSFIATEIDKFSLEVARSNVSVNSMEDRIKIFPVQAEEGILVPLLSDPDLRVNFTMCNPPFYSSADEISKLNEFKELEPSAICTGSKNEMITEGGEEIFVQRMIEESQRIGQRCQWFTSMLGKQSSLFSVVRSLRKHKIENYVMTQLVQGTTKRWVIGWSFQTSRVDDTYGRFRASVLQELMPPSNCPTQYLKGFSSPEHVMGRLLEVVANLDSINHRHLEDGTIILEAEKNSWSRAERRKRARTEAYVADPTNAPRKFEAVLKAGFWVKPSANVQNEAAFDHTLYGRWLFGRERALWQSFWSHIVRKLVP